MRREEKRDPFASETRGLRSSLSRGKVVPRLCAIKRLKYNPLVNGGEFPRRLSTFVNLTRKLVIRKRFQGNIENPFAHIYPVKGIKIKVERETSLAT